MPTSPPGGRMPTALREWLPWIQQREDCSRLAVTAVKMTTLKV